MFLGIINFSALILSDYSCDMDHESKTST